MEFRWKHVNCASEMHRWHSSAHFAPPRGTLSDRRSHRSAPEKPPTSPARMSPVAPRAARSTVNQPLVNINEVCIVAAPPLKMSFRTDNEAFQRAIVASCYWSFVCARMHRKSPGERKGRTLRHTQPICAPRGAHG
jgi:hypothetical protein